LPVLVTPAAANTANGAADPRLTGCRAGEAAIIGQAASIAAQQIDPSFVVFIWATVICAPDEKLISLFMFFLCVLVVETPCYLQLPSHA
jgi:hypothetical protein